MENGGCIDIMLTLIANVSFAFLIGIAFGVGFVLALRVMGVQ